MKPISSQVPNPPRKVAELIDPTSAPAVWREDLIREVFVPVDAEAILRIPICTKKGR